MAHEFLSNIKAGLLDWLTSSHSILEYAVVTYLLIGATMGIINYSFQKKRFNRSRQGMSKEDRSNQARIRSEEKAKFDKLTAYQKMKDVGFTKGTV